MAAPESPISGVPTDIPIPGPVKDFFGTIWDGLSATATVAEESAKFFRTVASFFLMLFEPSTWLRFLLFNAGLATIGLGGYLFVSK